MPDTVGTFEIVALVSIPSGTVGPPMEMRTTPGCIANTVTSFPA